MTESTPNLNTYVIGIGVSVILGALAWVGTKASSNNDDLKTLTATVPYIEQGIRRVEGQVSKVEGQVSNLVTRSEHASEISQIKQSVERITVEQNRLRDARP